MGEMKIEKMWTKQDVVANLKKAAKLSNMEQLKKIAEYIQTEIELDNLKDDIVTVSYEIKYCKGHYQIVKIRAKYNTEKNCWEQQDEETLYNIPIEEIEKVVL